MAAVAQLLKKKKSANVTLEAGDALLRAVKRKIIRQKGKVDAAALRRAGYSNKLVERLKAL